MTQEQNVSRMDLIKSARESCNQALSQTKLPSQNLYKSVVNNEVTSKDTKSKVKDIVLYLRIVIAVLIFISVVAIDKFGYEFNKVNTELISQTISYNLTLQDVDQFVKELDSEKIVEVFNRLK